jgi:hypothetical protein
VQKILGHDRLQTTAIYLNFTDTHIQEEFSSTTPNGDGWVDTHRRSPRRTWSPSTPS